VKIITAFYKPDNRAVQNRAF